MIDGGGWQQVNVKYGKCSDSMEILLSTDGKPR